MREDILKHPTPSQGITGTPEKPNSLYLDSVEIVNSLILILPFSSKMQKLQLLKVPVYFGSVYMNILVVRCKPILETLKCEEMSAIELKAERMTQNERGLCSW